MEATLENFNVEQQQVIAYLMDNLGMTEEQAVETIELTEIGDAPAPIKRFCVDDYSSADWVLQRIAETEAEISQIHKMLDDQIDALRKRAERILQPLQNKLNFFTINYAEQLESWTKQELQRTKKKSLKLLYGKVGIKTGSVSTELLTSEEEIVSIIERLPVGDPFAEEDYYPGREFYELNEKLQGAIKVSKSILKSPLKSALEDGWDGTLDVDGQKVSIARVKKSDDSFYFETELPK